MFYGLRPSPILLAVSPAAQPIDAGLSFAAAGWAGEAPGLRRTEHGTPPGGPRAAPKTRRPGPLPGAGGRAGGAG
jgi:hypothetical protein